LNDDRAELATGGSNAMAGAAISGGEYLGWNNKCESVCSYDGVVLAGLNT